MLDAILTFGRTFSCPNIGKDSLIALYGVFFRFTGKKTSKGRFYVYQYLVKDNYYYKIDLEKGLKDVLIYISIAANQKNRKTKGGGFKNDSLRMKKTLGGVTLSD
jgi:hypothetical protein